MFLVFLRFSSNRDRAGELMDGHAKWIAEGFDDGVFLLTGTVPGVGGSVLAYQTTLDELRARVEQDPFVAEGVVEPEIIEIEPDRVESRLDAILAGAA